MLISFMTLALANELTPPTDPEELQTWWKDAGGLYIGETSYRVQETKFSEGLCAFGLKGGVLTPVFMGTGTVQERMVGFVYSGSGSLSVRFPQRADAWSFSNHMGKQANLPRNELLPVALQKKAYRVEIDRGLFLSANPAIQNLRNDLEPIGKGKIYSYNEAGVVEASLVTNSDELTRLEKIDMNTMLQERSKNLKNIGINIRSMIRQDRLFQDHLGIERKYMRSIADFRTTQRFHVAGQEGSVIDSMAYDKWLSCFQDRRDELNIGYQSMVFSQGIDADKRYHFQRFSGIPLTKKNAQNSPLGLKSVYANSTIHITPIRGGADQKLQVDSLLTFESNQEKVQHLVLELPTKRARAGTWEIEALELEDGSLLSWAGLNANLDRRKFSASRFGKQKSIQNNKDLERLKANEQLTTNSSMNQPPSTSDSASESSSQEIGDAETIQAADPFAATQLSMTEQDTAAQERDVFQESGFTYKIIVILPQEVQKGESITIRLRWSAHFPYANMRTAETSQGVVVRSAGSSTGLLQYLPTTIPSSGGSLWKFYTKIATEKKYSRKQKIVASGKTQKMWEDQTWNWISVDGKKSSSPSIGLGKWKRYEEKSSQSMPSISVNVFSKNAFKRKQFPSEIRRIISFMQKFLPSFPQNELDLHEEQSDTLRREQAKPGIITLRSMAITAVGQSGKKRAGNKFITQEQIAEQIAGQYWGQKIFPKTSREIWLMDSLPNAYANFYLRAVHGVEEYTTKMETLRDSLEKPKGNTDSWKVADSKSRPYSLTGSTRLTDIPLHVRQNYGFYIFAEMLRLRIGNQAFFAAMENIIKMRKNDFLTTEEVQKNLELSSKQKLSDFFDYWIHGGYIPSLTVTTRVDTIEGKSVMFGCITSDLPYGLFDVPIRITLPNKSIDTFIKMNHGFGSFTIPNANSKTKIEIDPLGLILAYNRTYKTTTQKTTCSKDPRKD
ncbi:MAG: hypothetical protein CL916_07075 [Deltaproteobacteria bacterium]|nr:hypothetical protein [Deltaproteobacteria bacterium]